MNLSYGGRIVIIDDKFEEIKPLLALFGKNGMPCLYYDGTFERLPDSHPGGVRFVFLDIQLMGMEGHDDKTKASGIIGCLNRIISKSNGPYVIVFWTRHPEIEKIIIQQCTGNHIPDDDIPKINLSPVRFVRLEKTFYLSQDNIDDLSRKLNEELSKIGAFLLYVEWENILHNASKAFIHEFANHARAGDNWSKDTSDLFYKLYESYVGEKNTTDIKDERFRYACSLMNRSFHDTLQRFSNENLTLPQGFTLDKGVIKKETIARLNTSLFLNVHFLSERPSTGYVYCHKDNFLNCILLESICKKLVDKCEDSVFILLKIIITPECDLAYNKTLKAPCKPQNNKIHRIVYGLLFSESKMIQSNQSKPESIFSIGPFWYEGDVQMLILNFGTISFQHEDEFTDKPIFALSRDLIFDIQSKAANHVNRLGNFQLGYKINEKKKKEKKEKKKQ
ncbi:MAG: hypothetical protein HQK89_07730 [Nitrospirae bacterium]|nr:hypothetical protein [Nitrospirota bacterium]